jgi:MFS transporter, DHA2 family, metal-tetracycline-proton antiporter
MDTNAKKLIPWIIYVIFFAVLNETVFNVSTPKIAEQFALSSSGVSWMMTIFMIFFGIGSVVYGRLADIYSLRKLIIFGIVVYNIGSVMGFVLQFSYPLVVISRAVQGIGASAIPPLVFVVAARYFPPEERGKIFGFITSAVSFGIGLGPVIGGFVSGSLHWAYLFFIPLFILISIPFFKRILPEEPRREGKVDILGAVLVALVVGALVVYLNFGHWYYLLLFVFALIICGVQIRKATEPFIKPSLLKNVKFRNGVIVGFCLFSIVIGILFLVPLMLHEVFGMNTSQIGLVLFPGAMSSVIFGPIGGNMADKRGNNLVVAIGLVLLIVSMIAISLLLSISPWIIAAALLLTYVGFSFFQTALINSVSQTLPDDEAGGGMGLFNLVCAISGAVGTAIVGKLLDTKWLDFSFISIVESSNGYAYSNLLLFFSPIVILSGVLYLYSYRKMADGVR